MGGLAALLSGGVLTEAHDAARRAGKLFDLRESYRERFGSEGARSDLLAAVQHLFARFVTDICEVEESLSISF